jgi:hypothetical protein
MSLRCVSKSPGLFKLCVIDLLQGSVLVRTSYFIYTESHAALAEAEQQEKNVSEKTGSSWLGALWRRRHEFLKLRRSRSLISLLI